MNCPTCGEVVPVGIQFCANCGAEVVGEKDLPPASDTGTVVDTGPAPYLIVTSGPARGQTFELRGEVRLGRDRSNAIVLTDGKVSRSHARLDPIRDTYILTDLGSANGTFVNGVRIKQPVRLRDSDLIHVGDTQLVFHTGLSVQSANRFLQADHHPASSPPPPIQGPSPGPAQASFGPLPTSLPTWAWLGCAALAIVIILLIIVAVATGILIGQGLIGI